MRKFVFWTGIYDIVGGVLLIILVIAGYFGKLPPLGKLVCCTILLLFFYLGIVLILCSRDLRNRASLVYWEGVLRIFGFILFAGFGFLGEMGIMLGIFGIVDLIIGLVYLIGIPKFLKTVAINIILDRVT